MLLPGIFGGISPRIRHGFGDFSVHYAFLGQPRVVSAYDNPGNPKADDLFREKLQNLFKYAPPGNIIYPVAGHNSVILQAGVEDNGLELSLPAQLPRDQHNIHVPNCDGIWISADIMRNQRVYLVLRTRDCVPLIGVDNKGNVFLVHVSNKTLCAFPDGDKTPNFDGPILEQLFGGFIEDLEKCYVGIGPCIAGHQNYRCGCYVYDENDDRKDGSLLASLIKESNNFDITPFQKPIPNEGKVAFHWGELIWKLLVHWGIPDNNVDMRFNFCTKCDDKHGKWYSQRRERETEQSAINTSGGCNLAIAWIEGY